MVDEKPESKINPAQFIVISYLCLILFLFCLVKGFDEEVWLIGAISLPFVWLFIFFSNRYKGQRGRILKYLFLPPLIIALLSFGVFLAINAKSIPSSRIQIPFPYQEQNKITGKASINSIGNLTGNIYNDSNWQLEKLIVDVELDKDKRAFDIDISVAPKEAKNFSEYTGLPSSEYKKFSWSIKSAFGRRINHPNGQLSIEGKKEIDFYKTLITLSNEERLSKINKAKNDKSIVTFFLTMDDSYKSDSYLYKSISTDYFDSGNPGKAIEYLELAQSNSNDKTNESIYHGFAQVYRYKKDYKTASKYIDEGLSKSTSSLVLIADKAINNEYLGYTGTAIKSWNELLDRLGKAENPTIWSTWAFNYEDLEYLKINDDKLDQQFIRNRIDRLNLFRSIKLIALILSILVIAGIIWFIGRKYFPEMFHLKKSN